MADARYFKLVSEAAVTDHIVSRGYFYKLNSEIKEEKLDTDPENCGPGLYFTTEDHLFFWARALRRTHVVDVELCKTSNVVYCIGEKFKTDCYILKNLRSLADFSLHMKRESLLKLASSRDIRGIIAEGHIHSSLKKDKEFIASALKSDGKVACELSKEEMDDPELKLLAIRYGGYKCVKNNGLTDLDPVDIHNARTEGKVRSNPRKYFLLSRSQQNRTDLQEIAATSKRVFAQMKPEQRSEHSVRMAAYNAHPSDTLYEMSFWERVTFFYNYCSKNPERVNK